jgi:hypothetical protein
MEAGVSNHVWDLSEVFALIDAAEESVNLAAQIENDTIPSTAIARHKPPSRSIIFSYCLRTNFALQLDAAAREFIFGA